MKNRLKTEIELEEKPKARVVDTPEPEVETSPSKGGNKVGRAVSTVVSGRFLISEQTLKHFPFLFFLAFMGLLYIANGYYAQSKDRELDTLNTQIKDLNTQYQIAKAKLMYLSKESEVAKASTILGLKESVTPPDKIVINNQLAKK
jgi:hypothetical protein